MLWPGRAMLSGAASSVQLLTLQFSATVTGYGCAPESGMARCLATDINAYLRVSAAPWSLVLRGCRILQSGLGWHVGGFVNCFSCRKTCVVDATHCSAAQIAPRCAMDLPCLHSRADWWKWSHVFFQGKSPPGRRRAALAPLMWNGVDTTSRATIPIAGKATASCNPTLQLGFSFCQNGSSCSGLLMSWHTVITRLVEVEHHGPA